MSWVRIDDNFPDHPKIEPLSDKAFRLHISGLCYASRNLTDGTVPIGVVMRLLGYTRKSLQELLDASVWHKRDAEIEIHDYLQYNPDKQAVLHNRASGARRQSLAQTPAMRTKVRDRDGDVCRYCARPVNWTDRRGSGGGTYDHVDPSVGNDFDNLVVCCRGCNAKKGRRTPQEARMPLRAPPDQASRNLDIT